MDLQVDFAIGELPHHGPAELDAEMLADFPRQLGVGIAGEDLQTVVIHRAYRLRGGHVLPVMCSSSARHHIER